MKIETKMSFSILPQELREEILYQAIRLDETPHPDPADWNDRGYLRYADPAPRARRLMDVSQQTVHDVLAVVNRILRDYAQ